MYPAAISAPTPTLTPNRATGRIWFISVRRCRCRPRGMRVLVIQEAFVESKSRLGTTGRTYTETRVFVHVVVFIVLTKCIVQLLRTRCAATASTAWHRA